MSTFNSRPESVPWQRENLQQATQCRHLNSGQKAIGLVCAEWDQSAFSSVDKRRNLTDQDITEPILESDSWHTFIGRQRHFCSEWRWHYGHKLRTVDSQYTLSYCTCTPQVYKRFQEVMKKRGTSHQSTLFPSKHSRSPHFWKYTTVGGRDKQILSPALGHTGLKKVPIAWHDI